MSFMVPHPFVAQPVHHEAHALDAVTATARPSSGGRALHGVQDPRRRALTPRPTAATIGEASIARYAPTIALSWYNSCTACPPMVDRVGRAGRVTTTSHHA